MNESDAKYKSLIKRCKSGSKEAQRELYEGLFGLVFTVARRYLKDDTDAKDLTQECFIKLFDSLEKFSFKGSFEGWAARMATNMCLDHLKKSRPDFLDFEKAEFFLQSQVAESEDYEQIEEEYKRVKKALDHLPTGYKTVVIMYALQGYKHREIAELLDITVGSSKSMYARGKKLLLEKLKTTEYTNE